MLSYWKYVRKVALELGSDGCTWALEFYRDCCLEHDVHYRLHRRVDDAPITKAEADSRLWECIVARSWFGRWSPLAWWRWRAVSVWARKTTQEAWDSFGASTK